MTKVQRERTPASEQLVWQGELTIQRVAGLKEELQEALARVDSLLLSLTEVSAVDLAFLQLLCAGHRTAAKLNKQLALVGEPPRCFTETVQLAGFSRRAGCPESCQQGCLQVGARG